MPALNSVHLIGNLTRDPQVKFLPSQTQVAEFGIACNRKFKTAQGEEKEEVTFIDCTAFGKTAETIGKYCQKGKLLFIDGRLKYDSWEDKQGGGRRSKLTVVVENFQFLGSGGGGAGSGGGEEDQRPAESPQPRQASERGGVFAKPAPTMQSEIEDDSIPF